MVRGRRVAPVLAGLGVWGIGWGWCVPCSVVSPRTLTPEQGALLPAPFTALPAFPSTTAPAPRVSHDLSPHRVCLC